MAVVFCLSYCANDFLIDFMRRLRSPDRLDGNENSMFRRPLGFLEENFSRPDSELVVQEKMNQCDVPDTFLTPCFFTRGHIHVLLSLVPKSSSTSLFCHGNTRESRRLFYVCMSVIFFESQNKQHAYLLHVRKMQNVCVI